MEGASIKKKSQAEWTWGQRIGKTASSPTGQHSIRAQPCQRSNFATSSWQGVCNYQNFGALAQDTEGWSNHDWKLESAAWNLDLHQWCSYDWNWRLHCSVKTLSWKCSRLCHSWRSLANWAYHCFQEEEKKGLPKKRRTQTNNQLFKDR